MNYCGYGEFFQARIFMLRPFLSGIITVVSIISCGAQDIAFEHFGINDGLSQNTVSAIHQDSRGFMWFGTRDGLNKYDGYQFTVYKRNLENKNCISANDIKAIVEDDSANLWIATWSGGLNKFNIKTAQFTHYRNRPGDLTSISSDYIKTLFFDSKGRLWIGTGNNGLDLFDHFSQTFTHFKTNTNNEHSISDNTINDIMEDSENRLWIATAKGGVNLFNPENKKFLRYTHDPQNPNSIPDNNVQFIHEDHNNNLLVGTYGGGLATIEVGTNKVSRHYHKDYDNSLFLISITEDRDANLWIGTENEGLKFFDQSTNSFKTYIHYDNDISSIGSNSILSLYEDTKGNVWIGTFQGGVNMIYSDVKKFKHYKYRHDENSISSNTVTTIYEDSKENIWIGTDGGGLNLFDPIQKTFSYFTSSGKNPICSNYVLTVCEDKNNNVWVGTWGNGISVLDKNHKIVSHHTLDKISSKYVFYIYRDSQDRIWLGTYGGGLNRYDQKKNTFQVYTHQEKKPFSISSNYILTIYEDSDKRLWIGTDGGGLNYFEESSGRFYSYKYDKDEISLSNNIINSICEDENKSLWLGTNFGLNQFDPEQKKVSKHFFSENGLPNDVITGLLKDEHNNLWIGTSKGLSKFTPSTYTFKNFTLSDGIQANDFRAQCLSKRGLMYFGGKNGFNEFLPSKIKALDFDPPVAFTSFKIFNKEVPVFQRDSDSSHLTQAISETEEISLTYKESVITFEFASLNYTGKEKKQYMYLLEGFDKSWNFIGTKNNVTYTNLDPGAYHLHVKGLTNDGKWSNNITTIKLTIRPPFWQTWWFKIITVIVCINLVFLIFYLRVSSIKKQNKKLEEDVEKRTKELSEANTYLIESNEEVKLQNEKLEEFNHEMVRQSEKILRQQKKIVVQNQELEETVNQLERTNATKDRFFSILAHDLKNPVAALTGISDELKNSVKILTKEEIGGYLHHISQSSHAIDSLITNLLEWGKSHSKNIPVNRETINVYQLIIKNLALIEQQLRRKHIEFKMGISDHHSIYADYPMADTIVRNVLNNAIKFTPPHGGINVASKEIEDIIEIQVSDTGIGMSQKELSHLFKLEKKHHAKGTNGESGIGLGLIVTKEFLGLNKGDIEVFSVPDQGSTFSLRFPKTKNQDTQNSPSTPSVKKEHISTPYSIEKIPEEKIEKIKGKRILIVDDNKEIRSFLRLMLSDTCEIFEAAHGKEGIQVAHQSQPALIISDMVMPVMGGLEFCEKIKSDPATSHIPVIMLTSQTQDEHHAAGYAAGADVYLTKPLKHAIFFEVIITIITNQEKIVEKFSTSLDPYPSDIALNNLDEAFVSKMIEYIEAHISEPDLDHTKLCEVTSMSRSLLYTKCKTITGFGVHSFIKSIRLKKGLKILLEGKMNISQTAFQVGFTTPSHFTKSFTKQYGVSPTEYLNNLKKKNSKK